MNCKLTQEQIRAELKNFAEASYTKYQSYSYAAGYFESFVAELVADLPKAKQESVMAQIRRSTGNL